MDWKAIAEPWLRVEAETDAAHAPVRAALFEAARLMPGQSVLDIGPGGGISLLDAASAVGETGHVTGVEVAPPFIERAAARTPDTVTLVEGDAGTLAFTPREFDAAISLFGVMFFAEPVSAFANIRTALKPGCALTFACWGPPQANPWFSMPSKVAVDVIGPGPAFDPDAPGPMALASRDKINEILGASGWSVEIDTKDMLLTPMGAASDVARLQMQIGAAASRMGRLKEEGLLTDDIRHAIRAGLEAGFEALATADGVRVPAQIHIVQARA